MGARVTLTLSLILIGWVGLVWFHRELVAPSHPLVHASVWLVVGLVLLVKGLREGKAASGADPPTTGRVAAAWLIASLPLFAWLVTFHLTRPGWIALGFTQSSYATPLSASAVAALVALSAGLVVRVWKNSQWTGAARILGTVGGAAALLLVTLSLWTHARVDHSETGRYGEMAVGFFVLEHPIFWTIAILGALALWLSRRGLQQPRE